MNIFGINWSVIWQRLFRNIFGILLSNYFFFLFQIVLLNKLLKIHILDFATSEMRSHSRTSTIRSLTSLKTLLGAISQKLFYNGKSR